MSVQPPDLASSLAETALRAAAATFGPDLSIAFAPEDVPDDLRRWARDLATKGGVVELLGMRLRTDAFPGLVWNGALLARTGRPLRDGLALVARTAAPDATPVLWSAAVAAGTAVALDDRLPRAGTAVASVDTVAAAACAAIARELPREHLPIVLDLAGSLMVIGPTEPGVTEAALRTGHALASGWLAAVLADPGHVENGVVGVPGGLAHTLRTITGEVSDS